MGSGGIPSVRGDRVTFIGRIPPGTAQAEPGRAFCISGLTQSRFGDT